MGRATGIWDHGRGPNGKRLANPRDPVVRRALERTCPVCNVEPGVWCIGVAENSRTCGRQRTRLHFDRAQFVEVPA
jgi:hypothetical protein